MTLEQVFYRCLCGVAGAAQDGDSAKDRLGRISVRLGNELIAGRIDNTRASHSARAMKAGELIGPGNLILGLATATKVAG